MKRVVVIGAGMGGLTAALRLVERGYRVTVIEARPSAGGLASRERRGELEFDVGPYILLDRPGLEWVCDRLGLALGELAELRRIDEVYRVTFDDAASVTIYADLDRTANELERNWPGSGRAYRRLIERLGRAHRRTRPLQWVPRPTPWQVIRRGAWRDVPLLLRPLSAVLARAELPAPVERALSIWTHVAGQRLDQAPGVLAMVPGLIHTVGAYHPVGGIGALPARLAELAEQAGVDFTFGSAVERILVDRGTVRGVRLAGGERVEADAVVANCSGLAAYLELLDEPPPAARRQLEPLPLQSPGLCAYLSVRAPQLEGPYLVFRLRPDPSPCELIVRPSLLHPELEREGRVPMRLVAPLAHGVATSWPAARQREHLQGMVDDPWWRDGVNDVELLGARTVVNWSADFNLFRSSMNPVMTARLMRRGRLRHRSPWIRGLYLAGSATHPGQWVSFAAVSGIHAADLLHQDSR